MTAYRTDHRYKIDALLRTAEATTDTYIRETCIRQAKTLIDLLEPFVDNDAEYHEPVGEYLKEYYVVTRDRNDRVSKTAFDNEFLVWASDNGYQVGKKEIRIRLLRYGVECNQRTNIGEMRGVYGYIGIRQKGGQECGK